MKRLLRQQLELRAPTLFNSIRTIRNRRYFRRQFSQLHADFRRQLFPHDTPISVQCGPFRGMRYFDEIVWGSITPKWLGSYEAELHGTITQIANHNYRTIIDVGCAEGYYAIGAAVIKPKSKVIAFDTDFISRRQIRRLARLNRVEDRVHVRTYCSHADLNSLCDTDTLVLSDIEGFEAQLINPEIAPALLRSDVLVEVHEETNASQTVECLLQARFAASHRIERITATDRASWIDENRRQIPQCISNETLRKATDENRATGRVWLWMQAHRA